MFRGLALAAVSVDGLKLRMDDATNGISAQTGQHGTNHGDVVVHVHGHGPDLSSAKTDGSHESKTGGSVFSWAEDEVGDLTEKFKAAFEKAHGKLDSMELAVFDKIIKPFEEDVEAGVGKVEEAEHKVVQVIKGDVNALSQKVESK